MRKRDAQLKLIGNLLTNIEGSRYRGMGSFIIANMYEEWIDRDCDNFVNKITINVNAPNMHEHLEDIVKGGDETAFVVYGGKNAPEDEIFHIALLMIRRDFGVEYVDCMANPENPSQMKFEAKCRDLCRRYNKTFVSSDELFSYIPSEETYDFFPPQTAEQQFIGFYKVHRKYFHASIQKSSENEQRRMIQFAERYGGHDGGDCVFWASHIAYHLQNDHISAYDWFRQQDWFNEPDIMRAGSYILKYVTNKIFESLLRCQKSKNKNRRTMR